MSKLLSASDIAKRALRLIGAFPITETAPEPEYMDEALIQLDMLIAYVAGTNEVVWLIPQTLEVPIVGGIQDYDLNTYAAQQGGPNGVQKPIEAWLDDGNGNVTPLPMITRIEFEDLSPLAQSGRPEVVYIDRMSAPTMKIHPIPAQGVDNFKVRLNYETYSNDLTLHNGQQATLMRAAWNLWATFGLAEILGNGAVRKVPEAELKRIGDKAAMYLLELLQTDNREAVSYPRQVAFNG